MNKFKLTFVLAFMAFGVILLTSARCKKDPDPEPEPEPTPITCTLNISGGCFDEWVSWDDGYGFKCLEPAGSYLRTLNYLTTLPGAVGGPGPQTTDSSTDSYSGKYAALMTTKSFSPQGTPILIPGIVGTDSLDIPNSNIRLGKRYTLKPVKLLGYYKYQPVGADSGIIMVLLSKYNTVTHSRDTVAFNQKVIKSAVTTYTAIDMPIIYHTTSVTPDTITFLAASSGGVKFQDVMHCVGEVGSKLWIDEVSFQMP